MKFIEKLLQGEKVEWKPLGEVLIRTKGTKITASQMKELHKENAPIKIFAGGKTIAFVDFDDIPKKDVNYNTSIIVKSRGIIEFEFYDKPFSHKNEMWSYYSNNENIYIKYVYYYLKNNESYFQDLGSRMQMPQISIPDTDKFLIPIPPLSVQQEIAKILDKFSTLTAELQAELQARKSQYEYYRNQLLTYPMDEYDRLSLRSSGSYSSITRSNHSSQPQSESDLHTNNSVWQQRGKVEWKTLGEIALKTENIKWKETDKTYQYIDLTSVSRENNSIIETIEINKDSAPSRAQKIVEKDDIIFATTRPTQMRLALIADDYHGQIASTGYCVLRVNQKEVLPKWIFFCLTAIDFKDYLEENQSGSAYPAISDSKLKEYKIPLPPIEEQKRIADILDKFDTLVNSISEGLPKEIELRRKQYEYYREQLLMFNY